MADEADMANDRAEIELRRSLNAITESAKKPIPKRKTCLNCGEKTTKGARYCDHDCQIDHERRSSHAKTR